MVLFNTRATEALLDMAVEAGRDVTIVLDVGFAWECVIYVQDQACVHPYCDVLSKLSCRGTFSSPGASYWHPYAT